MGYFYIDESIRENGAFIVSALIYSRHDLTDSINACLEKFPNITEYKSSTQKTDNQAEKQLRCCLQKLLSICEIGLVVSPSNARGHLGNDILIGLSQIIEKCQIGTLCQIYFDQEIDPDKSAINEFLNNNQDCTINLKQDSKLIKGIQLADLVAHSLGSMLLEELGIISKKVEAGENSGYEPTLKIELGFELWARMRYSFFMSPTSHGTFEEDQLLIATFDVEGYGLYIPQTLPAPIAEAVRKRFGTNYLGCIH